MAFAIDLPDKQFRGNIAESVKPLFGKDWKLNPLG
jgi:hypothetical protein